ncbi:S-adenosyl-L-methionine-dependent methyltransferase [Dipodascopsis tothii]|uniref:S-adenosyl-L-methionine-dependent methyltransferase n=1 Tax=Dipodascopsis tothii TaxID=44089 RepID=UPI0034CF7DD3
MAHQVVLELADTRQLKQVKTVLEAAGLFDRAGGIVRSTGATGDPVFRIHTTKIVDATATTGPASASVTTGLAPVDALVTVTLQPVAVAADAADGVENTLQRAVRTVAVSLGLSDLTSPRRYSTYGNLLLVPPGSFADGAWAALDAATKAQALAAVAAAVGVTHIAANAPIVESDNVMRKPTGLVGLLGHFGPDELVLPPQVPVDGDFAAEFWAETRQNDVYQTWAPRYTMFSRGNVKEKARVLRLDDIAGRAVVDLYAGIGYFTLSYLRAGARAVFCWEINPWSVEGLRRGCAANGYGCRLVRPDEPWTFSDAEWAATAVQPMAVVFLEDNQRAPARLAASGSGRLPVRHINLGLLPSSEDAWPVALTLARDWSTCGGCVSLHVHANVAQPALENWMATAGAALGALEPALRVQPRHLERIKTFAPGVFHVCGDFDVAGAD